VSGQQRGYTALTTTLLGVMPEETEMFDEQPDGGPHGECAAEIRRLEAENGELLDLLAVIFDAYEDGPQCYEDPEGCNGFLGYAVHLDNETFQRTADILNKRRPRVTPNTN